MKCLSRFCYKVLAKVARHDKTAVFTFKFLFELYFIRLVTIYPEFFIISAIFYVSILVPELST